jgi:hypothetical protein
MVTKKKLNDYLNEGKFTYGEACSNCRHGGGRTLRGVKCLCKSLCTDKSAWEYGKRKKSYGEIESEYAELGRLAMKVDPCPYVFGNRHCRDCNTFEFCQKRAELLLGEGCE